VCRLKWFLPVFLLVFATSFRHLQGEAFQGGGGGEIEEFVCVLFGPGCGDESFSEDIPREESGRSESAKLRELAGKIARGEVDGTTACCAFNCGEKLFSTRRAEILSAIEKGGFAAGVAACLSGERAPADAILAGDDRRAQVALLGGCAKRGAPVLSLALLSDLLERADKTLSGVIEWYLALDARPEAQRLLRRRYPDRLIVPGWRPRRPGGRAPEVPVRDLYAEMDSAWAPDEIYALIGPFSPYSFYEYVVVRVFGESAYVEYRAGNGAVTFSRGMTAREFKRLKSFVSQREVDSLPDRSSAVADAGAYEYVHLTRLRGWSVFFESPDSLGGTYSELTGLFGGFTRKRMRRISVPFLRVLPSAKILFSDPDKPVLNVCREGGRVRVLVPRKTVIRSNKWECPRPGPTVVEWRELREDGTLGAVVKEPESFRIASAGRTSLATYIFRSSVSPFNRRIEKQVLRTKRRIKVPGTPWIFAGERDPKGSSASRLVRINSETGEKKKIFLGGSPYAVPVAYVRAHEGVLAYRPPKCSSGPEYYLVDPESGRSRAVAGEFRPLLEAAVSGWRDLQPTKRRNEFWAARPPKDLCGTEIGRYLTEDFTFEPVLRIPLSCVGSLEFWADEEEESIYVAVNGALVLIRL